MLRNVARKKDMVELRRFFKVMDDRYNTGLFDTNSDLLQTAYELDAQLFLDVVEDVYFPRAPYSFSVLNADFLGQVYELFLMKKLVFNSSGALELRDKPEYEGREIITTPQPLVDDVVRRALQGRLSYLQAAGDVNFESVKNLRVLDIAVGSSRFLLRAFDELVEAVINDLIAKGGSPLLYMRSEGDYFLTFEAKKQILGACLYGVDIDYTAVEIARFSLLVKLLEDERDTTLPTGGKILPNLDRNIYWGNTVVGPDFDVQDEDILALTNPFDWGASSLPEKFDVILGNPPYVKTEEMKAKDTGRVRLLQGALRDPLQAVRQVFRVRRDRCQKVGRQRVGRPGRAQQVAQHRGGQKIAGSVGRAGARRANRRLRQRAGFRGQERLHLPSRPRVGSSGARSVRAGKRL